MTEGSPVTVTNRADPARAARTRQRILTWVRRLHMYLGLLLFPWVIFFGLSGALFNHPGIGETTTARPLPAGAFSAAGLPARDPHILAEALVEKLAEGGRRYALDASFPPRLNGGAAFDVSTPGQKNLLLYDLSAGRGLHLSRPDRTPEAPPFASTVDVDGADLRALEPGVAQLLASEGLPASQDAPRLAVAPQLRLRLIDPDGRRWNATYDLGSHQIDGRPTDRWPSLNLHDLVGRLHKTHHFPPRLQATTFWALFADLTGVTLAIWAITGIVMWVQLKKTRALGAIAISVGVLVAAMVMVTSDEEIRFENVRPSEPGGKKAAPSGSGKR